MNPANLIIPVVAMTLFVLAIAYATYYITTIAIIWGVNLGGYLWG